MNFMIEKLIYTLIKLVLLPSTFRHDTLFPHHWRLVFPYPSSLKVAFSPISNKKHLVILLQYKTTRYGSYLVTSLLTLENKLVGNSWECPIPFVEIIVGRPSAHLYWFLILFVASTPTQPSKEARDWEMFL